MANTQQDLLELFADNDTNDITAARLRQFVNDVYAQMILRDDVLDTLNLSQAQEIKKPLSASRGWALQQQIDILEARITALE